MKKISMALSIIFFLLTAAVDFVGRFFDAYYIFPNMDIVAHTLGGVFLGFVAIYFLIGFGAFAFDKANFLMTAAFVGASAIVFEIGQYIFNFIFPYKQNNFVDTLSDIFVGLLGGIIGYAIFYLIYKKDLWSKK